ncbi:hypothetical protein OH146_02055 [Salinibacterium sp. SYSU T00001]|uniref:hypothetical protein n=1 Tax=Homoserinimonas sedimenticola TaxID=2986805 RepID=UPI0022365A4D|nr:hypothetical protein [Salinibacterium sedimenticola]MCW4384552.1 hypothetical protein [Salinibacterium sedimenticola]
MADPTIDIYDLMACNVYMDFDDMTMQHEQHKFLVAFRPTGAASVHEYIESLTARGPGGYETAITNQPFTNENHDGHIYDRTTDAHWYMVNIDGGFLESGEYTVEARLRDGSSRSISRVQDNGPGMRLLDAYREHRDTLRNSWRPARGEKLDDSADLTSVEVTQADLKELSGVDAFHIFRMCQGSGRADWDTQNLYWWDNIFLQRLRDPQAGLNRNTVQVQAALQPDTPYVYFTELTDSNRMGDTNMCIFQPHQHFVS